MVIKVFQYLLVVSVSIFFSKVSAQELKWFKLTDYGAYLDTRLSYEDSSYKSTGAVTTLSQIEKERELGFTTRSYVYHPNLLAIDFSGSASWDAFETDRTQTSFGNAFLSKTDTSKIYWDIDAQLHFLQKKRYPITLNYFRQNPLIATGLEGSFNQESQRYGFQMALRDMLPMDINLNANRSTNFGKTLDRIIDATSDQINFSATQSFSVGGTVNFDYNLIRQKSRSGDPRRMIRETQHTAHRATLDSRWRFGSNEQFYFTENANVNLRNNPKVMDVRFSPNLRWNMSERLKSTYRYNFSLTNRIENNQKNIRHSGSTSVEYKHNERLRGVLGLDANYSNQTEGLQQKSYGTKAEGFYNRPLSFGKFNLVLGTDYHLEDRETTTDRFDVRDESHQLSTDAPETLDREFVLQETIVVRNQSRTQTFIEDLDYLIVKVGALIQIERLAGGAILEGETVLIDYAVQTGGSYSYTRLGHKFIATLDIGRYYSLSLRHIGRQQSLTSGFSTLPLNSFNSLEISARADVPLRWWGIRVGGVAQYFRQDEDINPYDRIRVDTYMEIPFPYRINVNLKVKRYITNNKNSEQGEDAIGFTGLVYWRLRRNLTVTLMARFDEDSGSKLKRSRKEVNLNVEWRFRKLKFSTEASYQNQQQGNFNRDEFRVWVKARREFF